MGEKPNLFRVIGLAGAYIAFEIGSGFAAGQEILQFYTVYGAWGFAGALISMVVFAWAGKKLMAMGYMMRGENKSDQILAERPYQFICGRRAGFFFEKFVLLYVFGSLCVMFSGAGAATAEYFGTPHLQGSFFMAAAVFFAFGFGFEKMSDLIGAMGAVIILGILSVSVVICISEFDDIAENLGKWENSARLLGNTRAGAWWFSGILYAAYNLLGSVAFLITLGRRAKSRREAEAGGAAGGLILALTVMTVNLALFAQEKDAQVPMLEMAERIGDAAGFVFAVILILGIFSTAAPMLWTVCEQLKDRNASGRHLLLGSLVCADALVLGQLPFDKLVGAIYPAAGWLGIVLLIYLARIKVK